MCIVELENKIKLIGKLTREAALELKKLTKYVSANITRITKYKSTTDKKQPPHYYLGLLKVTLRSL